MLLSALVHDGTEFFMCDEKQLHKIKEGKIIPIERLPEGFLMLLDAELSKDEKAKKALDKMGLKTTYYRLYYFFKCNYSAFGGDADVKGDGSLGRREVVPCDGRDKCSHEGKLCQLPCGLTQAEARIARAIAMAQMDDEIRHRLGITQSTLRTHKNNIERKIGATGKVGIAQWTLKIGLTT